MRPKNLNSYFEDYKKHHRTRGNILTHYIGVTSIVIAILGLSSQVVFPIKSFQGEGLPFSLGHLIWILGSLFYFSLSIELGVQMCLVTFFCLLLGAQLGFKVNLILFITGWAFQFVGHYAFEKKSPSFFKNLTHLLIGPAFILENLKNGLLKRFKAR